MAKDINTPITEVEDITNGNEQNPSTVDILDGLKSNDKYRGLEEIEVGGHKVSFCEYKTQHNFYDVYLDGKLCGTIGSGYGIDFSSIDAIGKEIYFRNRGTGGPSFYERIKDGKIEKLEDVDSVFNVNGKSLYLKRTQEQGIYSVIFGDKDFGEYSLIYDVNGEFVYISPNPKLSFEIDRNGKFGFIGQKKNGKKVFVTEDFTSEEFDDIEVKSTGNILRMIGKTHTKKEFPELKQNRHS